MVGTKGHHCPNIVYRRIRPSDLEVLEQIHCDLFPIRYESEFFFNVVHGREIVSWGAVDRSRPGNQSDELIGFVTARIVIPEESEIGDMIRYDSSRTDQTLVYILTLGVRESYRNHGIATSLTREVIKYASSIPSCRAVYLHVIAYNNSAICFYKKMSFQCVRRLADFYFIQGQHYDSYLFVYYVNGGRSPCSPLVMVELTYCYSTTLVRMKATKGEICARLISKKDLTIFTGDIVAAVATYVRSLCKSLAARLWKNEEKIIRWPKCKENNCLLVTQNKRNLTTENECQCV